MGIKKKQGIRSARTRVIRDSNLGGDTADEHEDFIVKRPLSSRSGTLEKERQTLGSRVKQVREERGLTLEDISSRTGIAVDVLSRVESNEITPPLGQLVRLSKALDMKMGYFISPGVDMSLTIVRAHERRHVARHGKMRSVQSGYHYQSLAPEKGNRLMEPFLVTLLPTDREEFSTHEGQEFIFVLTGEMKLQVGKQTGLLRRGDAAYYDSNQPHLVKATGGKEASILAVLYTESR